MRQVVLFGLVALVVPATVFSGLSQTARRGTPAEARGSESSGKAGAINLGHQIRCWQYGRLILEENNLDVPPESSVYALTLTAVDRNRSSVHLVDTKNALCLIKNTEADPGRSSKWYK